MIRLVIVSLWINLFLLSCTSKPSSMKNDAFIEILDDQILDLIHPEAPYHIMAQGFAWTEGPLWLEEQQSLIFTDIPNNSIFRIDAKGELSLYLKPSGYTDDTPRGGEVGANGLTLDPQGRLVLCQHGDRRMARMDSPLDQPKSEFITLVDKYEGKRFNSPNDVVFDKAGNMYFTDPPYGLEFNMNDPAKELDFQGIYCLKTSGELVLLDTISRPNGLAFSRDEKYLYVANSDPKMAVWYRYEVLEDGLIHNKTLFFDATEFVGKEGFKGLPDGMKINRSGTIFATGPGGVWVFDPNGKVLARLRTGEATSNCAFSTDEKTFFMTADDYILKIDLK
ncbi:SMP-30/gluconolactonase/LRE family protein [Cecembia rubra]|uniref:Gluconolactonase n=1 Tax=Cecembia rubra TaxID=1485585 RepID=A0A2P8E206_9BACT|nr:SMP-30/gluconolactonase/LRE family protein [Cecembia rubra]PSL03447.1 gluconolactonase [Cecembia rubra]